MAAETYARLAVAYSNLVTPAAVSDIVVSNFTTVVGFPKDNLEYEDPHTILKTATVTGTPSIEFVFGSSKSPRVLGIINHTLSSAGVASALVEYHTGAAWSSLASISLLPSGNPDFWIGWTNVVSATRFRVTFNFGLGVPGNFTIGSIAWLSRRVMDVNPQGVQINQSREVEIISEASAGSAKHFAIGQANRDTAFLQLEWDRASIDDLDFIRTLARGSLVGVLPPEHLDTGNVAVMTGQEPFWGVVRRRTMSPRGPGGHTTTQKAAYAIRLELEGAV